MRTDPLFLEDAYDALKSIVQVAGGAKVVGPLIFPEKSTDAARTALLDALNPDRAQKLCFEQTLLLFKIGREAGYHGAKHWLDGELGYAPTSPIDPDDQVAELARVIGTASEQLRRATEALDRVRKGARR